MNEIDINAILTRTDINAMACESIMSGNTSRLAYKRAQMIALVEMLSSTDEKKLRQMIESAIESEQRRLTKSRQV